MSETVGHGDNPDAVEAQFLEDGEQQQRVSSQTRQVIHEGDVERAFGRRAPKRYEAGAILSCA